MKEQTNRSVVQNREVLVHQLCLTLCNPTDCNLPGFSVHGILQARILEWTAIPLFNKIDNPEINPYSQPIFDKGGKAIQWRNDSLLNKWCWNNRTSTCKIRIQKVSKETSHPSAKSLKIYHKPKLKHKAKKCLEYHTRENVVNLVYGNDFLDSEQHYDPSIKEIIGI